MNRQRRIKIGKKPKQKRLVLTAKTHTVATPHLSARRKLKRDPFPKGAGTGKSTGRK